MRFFAFLLICLAVFASVQAQGSQAQTGSQKQASVDTAEPTVQYLDIGKAFDPLLKGNITRNVTIAPRPDPRQIETPEPTYLPTLAPTPPPTPAPTADPGPWVDKPIRHDEVKPFAQPEPVTISEKAGVKFKPQIQIRTGCVPYPAVCATGETSGGLKTSGSPRGGCRGSGHGSQVYGRSTWLNGVWAIMYSWYFPKDSPSTGLGHRHDWEHAIVFIDNPDVPDPKIMGCSVSSHSGYKKYNPCPPYVVDGTSLKIRYRHGWPKNHDLDVTGDGGTFQDLIMWDQMTEDARRALNSVSFGSANTPMNDGNFIRKLNEAFPF